MMKRQYPKVIINAHGITENVRIAVDKCAAVGIDIMGITKVLSGLEEPNAAYIRGGVHYLGSSRLEQLQSVGEQNMKVTGATDDLTFVDVSRADKKYNIGDIIEFDITKRDNRI